MRDKAIFASIATVIAFITQYIFSVYLSGYIDMLFWKIIINMVLLVSIIILSYYGYKLLHNLYYKK